MTVLKTKYRNCASRSGLLHANGPARLKFTLVLSNDKIEKTFGLGPR